ncbi:PREDICTED: protein tweety isoform X2 [Nicrophorus vespilloides]|uniref:Protein tweety homolog n=1 Tax=Nicrophorus vespilloides TaxID=110193 RepID=A0ABM1MCF6_NICVS|nr:PREDICTED: protein tweety isoform X2 [Nicrophorus vespilloides]
MHVCTYVNRVRKGRNVDSDRDRRGLCFRFSRRVLFRFRCVESPQPPGVALAETQNCYPDGLRGEREGRSKGTGMGATSGDDVYSIPTLARLLHALPHLNVTFHRVNSSFDPNSPIYYESLGILASVPAAWLILTLLVLLIYLLTRCCDRKPRPSRSISAMKVTLAVVSVLCCAAVGLGLYGNDDLHNGFTQLLQEGKQVDQQVHRIKNQTENIERQLRQQANLQLTQLRDIFDEPISNSTALKQCLQWLTWAANNNTAAAAAAADIRQPLNHIVFSESIDRGEWFEQIRWPSTMAVLSVLLILCVVLLVGVARHSRCALIAFSVCGLLAVIASYVMASIYIASTVALGDLCMAPDKFIEDQAKNELTKEILRYYTSCERARANPFTQRLREAKGAIENTRSSLTALRKPALDLFPRKALEPKFSSLLNQVNEGDLLITALTASVDCRALHTHYLRGARALCNTGLLGLFLMLASAILAGLLLTVLVWVDSHTWIYIRKKKDYHQVNETDPYLPPPAASQAIAARTLQRSQGDGCDMRPTDHHQQQQQQQRGAHMSHLRGHTLGRLPSHHHEPLSGPNNGKYATLSKQCKTLESSDFY